MPFLDKVGEKLQKKSNHQQADMHTVHIGIGCDNHLIIPEPLDTVLYIKGSLQQVELLVLINDLLGQSVSIQRLTPQREDRLRLRITDLGNRTARRVPLGNENTALRPAGRLWYRCSVCGNHATCGYSNSLSSHAPVPTS